MDDYAKTEQLFMMSTEELINTPCSEWEQLFTGIHGDDLLLTANRLRELAVRAVRMAAYVDARGGEGGVDKGHDAAVKAQNDLAERVRAILDYQHPREELIF